MKEEKLRKLIREEIKKIREERDNKNKKKIKKRMRGYVRDAKKSRDKIKELLRQDGYDV